MPKKQTINEVLQLAFPAVGETVFYMLILILDTMMIGKYGGKISVSTVSICQEIVYACNSIFIDIGLAVAITSIVARKVGAQKFRDAENFAALGFFTGLAVSFVICYILFIFSPTILTIAGIRKKYLSLGVSYMRIACIGIFFKMNTGILNGISRGYGNIETPLFIAALISITNVCLDWILIFGNLGLPKFGFIGSAFAITIAQILGFLYAFYYAVTKSIIRLQFKNIFNCGFHKLKELLVLSIPTSLEETAFSTSKLFTLFIILRNSSTAYAANQITSTIESFSFMFGIGFNAAATTLIGIKVGERNYKKAKEYAYTCGVIGTSIMLLCSVIFVTMPTFLVKLFINKSELGVISQGTLCLMVASIEQPFMAVSLIFSGALKGTGDTRSPFLISLATSWLIRVPLTFYFMYIIKAPIIYSWWISTIQWCLDGLFMFLMFEYKFKKLNKSHIIYKRQII